MLKACYPDALRIDLLKTDELMRYIKAPSRFREGVAALSHDRIIMALKIPRWRFAPMWMTTCGKKFYFRDLGVVNHLARRGDIRPDSELFGKAFEN